MIDSIFETLQKVNREHFHHIWRRAQEGKLEGLTEEEERLGKIMLDHADVYFNQFEFSDVLADREFDPETEVNPFLHVVLHAAAEKQVQDRNPIEAFQFYNAMLRNKCSRHEVIHLLMNILLKFLFPILKQKKGQFHLEGYRNLLTKYKSRKPEKIFALLESEPDPPMKGEESSRSAQFFDEIGATLTGQNFKSTEGAQTFLDALMAKRNAEPIPEFLGLSSSQMNRLLYRPFSETSDIVAFNRNLSKEDLLGIPLVKEAIYFMKRLSELQPLKATAKGNLPQAFAREMHDQFPEHPYFHYTIKSEEDDSKLSALRHILDLAGWIKKRNQKFSLTQRGQDLLEKEFRVDDFYHLFETYVRSFNWAFRDLYSNLDIIQQGFLFSCYLLHHKAKTPIPVKELSHWFIQAFPAVLKKKERDPFMETAELVSHAFSVRFIERFCEYFGLVTIERKKGYSVLDYLLKVTPLFEEMFQWKLSGV